MSETETLRPSGNGTYQGHSGGGGYTEVNDVVADDWSSRINGGTGTLTSTFDIPTPSSVRGAILGVTVYVRACSQSASNPHNSYCALYNGSSLKYGSVRSLAPGNWAWVNHSYTWSTNPWTSAAWVVSDLTNLQIGWESRNGSGEVDCTQIYAVVEFIPSVGGQHRVIGMML